MKKNQQTSEKFNEFLAESINDEWTNFPYANTFEGQASKRAMTVALILWRFLRKFSAHTGLYGWEEKRSFISDFIRNNDLASTYTIVRVVAKIEALPTTVWRKLLWRENIDFADYESCLRRLNSEQIKAISDNYKDLFADEKAKTPRVLKKSWRDRIKVFFGMMSTDELLAENYNDHERNQSKGAYAFSLLGLDFGFSLYPHGDNNDERITNMKYTRFFSVKAHINDFIVNMEDGKYWWLYKTARSNYAFYPNKEVKMKTHVCPGFWLTLILQTLFWIVSPIALAITATVIAKNGFTPIAWLPFSFAFAMIIWITVLILRTAVNLISSFAEDNKFLKIVGATIGICVLIAILGIVAIVVIAAIGFSIYALAPVVGPLLATAFVLTAGFYFFFFFTCVLNSNGGIFDYSDIPAFVRFLLHLSVGAFVISLIDKFASTLVINFIVNTAQAFWEWYTWNLWISNWFIFTIVFFGLFIYFLDMFISDEKKFASFERTFTWLTRGFMTLTIIIFAIVLLRSGGPDLEELSLAPILALALLFIIAGFSFTMLNEVNKKTITERELAASFLTSLDAKIGGIAYKSFIGSILKCKWLPANSEAKWAVIDRIDSLAFTFFECYPNRRLEFVDLLIKKGSLEIIDRLDNSWRDILGINCNSEEQFLLVQMIIDGYSLGQATKVMESKRNLARRLAKRTRKFGKALAYPFVKIRQAICWVFSRIGQFFGTLKDLWDFFNKRCPFVTQPRYLD